MIEYDIENATNEEKTIQWKGQTLHVERILMNPEKDMVIFIGSCEGKRKAMRVSIAMEQTQAIVMGDLSPLFIDPQ